MQSSRREMDSKMQSAHICRVVKTFIDINPNMNPERNSGNRPSISFQGIVNTGCQKRTQYIRNRRILLVQLKKAGITHDRNEMVDWSSVCPFFLWNQPHKKDLILRKTMWKSDPELPFYKKKTSPGRHGERSTRQTCRRSWAAKLTSQNRRMAQGALSRHCSSLRRKKALQTEWKDIADGMERGR